MVSKKPRPRRRSETGGYVFKFSNNLGSVTSVDTAFIVLGTPTVNINLHAGIAIQGTVSLHSRVDYRTNLAQPITWTLLQNIPSLPSASFVVYDPAPASQAKRFYQAVPIPEPRSRRTPSGSEK